MDTLKVQKAQLQGQVRLSGAKNSTLNLLSSGFIFISQSFGCVNFSNDILNERVFKEVIVLSIETCFEKLFVGLGKNSFE